MTRICVCSGLLLGMMALGGCDERPAPPPAPTSQESLTPPAPKGPTTQEILTGPRKEIYLAQLPLRVSAPPGWRCEADSFNLGMNYLRGPTPTGGDIQIRLSKRPSQTAEQLDYLVTGAKRAQQDAPKQILVTEYRKGATMNILEKQIVGPAKRLTTQDPSSAIDLSPDYTWTLHVFVPAGGKDFSSYELSFHNLTLDRFTADKDFLRTILDTLSTDSVTTQP